MSPGSVGEKTLFTVEAIKKSIYHKLFYKTHLILPYISKIWNTIFMTFPVIAEIDSIDFDWKIFFLKKKMHHRQYGELIELR